MAKSRAPLSVDAVKPFEQAQQWSGEISVVRFRRLAPMLVDESGEVAVELMFSFDGQKRRLIEGRLSVTLNVECQRCLEPMAFALKSSFRIGVVDSEAMAEQLPRDMEPVLAAAWDIDLMTLIEDELIMSLPEFPLHGRDDCVASGTLDQINENADQEFERAREERSNPFSALAGLAESGARGGDPDE